jgi:hypothetical protein
VDSAYLLDATNLEQHVRMRKCSALYSGAKRNEFDVDVLNGKRVVYPEGKSVFALPTKGLRLTKSDSLRKRPIDDWRIMFLVVSDRPVNQVLVFDAGPT